MSDFRYRSILLAFVILFAANSASPQDAGIDSLFLFKETVTAGSEYNKTGISATLLGKHWRKLWITPFKAGVLDIEKFGGGITAYKRGGGLQTKSLHFRGNDGKKYKFRSLDKDPRNVLPPELRNSILADAFKDQISASHPYSAIIASRLLDEVGVLNAKPIVAILPDSESLGEFRAEFKGMLGTIEETPTGSKEGRKGFADADKIRDSYELYQDLEKDNDNSVDATEYLKARLLDLMLGDWDRHYDQWLWAGYKNDGKTVFKPIPRDRDQAFSLYDGLLPMIAGRAITQIEGYGKNYPPVYDLSFSGRYLDRRILPAAESRTYDSIATFIREKLRDEVIDEALRLMPPEWHSYGIERLKLMIVSRRDKLNDVAQEFYELINEVADIHCSNKNELVEIECHEDVMAVTVRKIRKDGTVEEKPLFSRSFDPQVTDQLRIYLNKGSDKVRINGGSVQGGVDYYYFPIQVRLVYDDGEKEVTNKDAAFLDYTRDVRSRTDLKNRFEPLIEDRGYDWRNYPILNYNPDDGLILGGNAILYHFDYGVTPFDYNLQFSAAYAFAAKSVQFEIQSDMYSVFKGLKFSPYFKISQLQITRFYGLGNETPLDKDKEKAKYYNVDQNLIYMAMEFEKKFSGKLSLSLIPFLKSANTSGKPGTIIGESPDIYGTGRLSFAGLNGILTIDSRNNTVYPQKGWYVRLYGNYTPAIMKNTSVFGKAGFDARAYYSTDTTRGIALALRFGAGKVWGTQPFYESLFLGGDNSLKGYSRERFGGEGLALAQGEIRLPITMINVLVPAVFGVSAFGGVGRVSLESEDSKKWHPAYGGSVWLSYLNRQFNFELSVADSDDGIRFTIGSAFFL